MNNLCYFCFRPVDLQAKGIYFRRTGWTEQRRGGGANKLSLASAVMGVAHGQCVEQESRNVARGQGVLSV